MNIKTITFISTAFFLYVFMQESLINLLSVHKYLKPESAKQKLKKSERALKERKNTLGVKVLSLLSPCVTFQLLKSVIILSAVNLLQL